MQPRGSLHVVGTGIQSIGDLTLSARGALVEADEVLYLANDALSADLIHELNPRSTSLHDLYRQGRDRRVTYDLQVERIMRPVRAGGRVCLAIYGHPGVFMHIAHESVARARREGHRARMMAGVSSFDWLVADLGFDPAGGCQLFEATDFLARQPRWDATVSLVLWQIGVIGQADYQPLERGRAGLEMLAGVLVGEYGREWKAIVYEAATLSVSEPRIEHVRLDRLGSAETTINSTLLVGGRGRAASQRQGANG